MRQTLLALGVLFGVCQPILAQAGAASGQAPDFDRRMFRDGCRPETLLQAEAKADPTAKKILAAARELTVERRTILPGACWNYVNTAWKQAGYPSNKRKTVFKSKKAGPYAKVDEIRPGDWLYFVNHSYNNIEHSALFIDWSDKAAKQGYMLSYAGEKRQEPARYLTYDLKSVFQIIRAKD